MKLSNPITIHGRPPWLMQLVAEVFDVCMANVPSSDDFALEPEDQAALADVIAGSVERGLAVDDAATLRISPLRQQRLTLEIDSMRHTFAHSLAIGKLRCRDGETTLAVLDGLSDLRQLIMQPEGGR